MRGPSHVVFGLAGAVVIGTAFHSLSGQPLLGKGAEFALPSLDLLAQKVIFYGAAGIGAVTPDIDNARSTAGKRLGPISKGIQHLAGHRTLFHSFVGLALVGAIVWAIQYGLGLALYHLGLTGTGAALGAGIGPGGFLAPGVGIAFGGLMVGYFLHLVADSLTEGGVPWLWPSHERFGFPPERRWRFRTGSRAEPIIVVAVAALVIVGVVFGVLSI
ncbi:MAG: metal-dependent hydrolase [Ktedonobacterales bacterium]